MFDSSSYEIKVGLFISKSFELTSYSVEGHLFGFTCKQSFMTLLSSKLYYGGNGLYYPFITLLKRSSILSPSKGGLNEASS